MVDRLVLSQVAGVRFPYELLTQTRSTGIMLTMRVRSVSTLRSFATLEEAQEYGRKINSGAGKHADCELEIEYDKKAKKMASLKNPDIKQLTAIAEGIETDDSEDEQGLQWKVVVVNDDPVPGGSECAECSATHFQNDYLCGDCRAAL